MRSEFLRTIGERGFVHQCTDPEALDARAAQGPITAYIGFDCTGDRLHVGHLVSIMMLRWLQQKGHKTIVMMGGGTTTVGDTAGKEEARKMLTDADIAANMAGIRKGIKLFMRFEEGQTTAGRDNNN